jgi:hypothetical protein
MRNTQNKSIDNNQPNFIWSIFKTSLNSQITTVEFVRFSAIVLIVVGHFEIFDYGGGASYTLFMIAGITYAKYIIEKINSNPKLALIDHTLLIFKIIIPTILYIILIQLMFDGHLSIDSIFLFSNWNPPKNLSYWFIEVYIQINLIFLIFAFFANNRKIIGGLKNFNNALIFFALTVFVAILTKYMADTSHLYDRVPNQMVWFFSAGILYAASNSVKEKIIFISIVVFGMFLTEKFSWLFLASVLMLGFVLNIKINNSLKIIITKISTASLFIYLTHFQWASLYRQISPYESKTMELIFALMGGVVLNIIYSNLWIKLKNKFTSKD